MSNAISTKFVFVILLIFNFSLQAQPPDPDGDPNNDGGTELGGFSPCLPEGIIFSTQVQIDSFQILHPYCDEIEGDVVIGSYDGTDITSLLALDVIETIGGSLLIFGNDQLNTLEGLNNLTYIAGDLKIGYEDVENDYGNENLNTLNLGNLTEIGGNFQIKKNPSLKNLQGLSNLSSIGGDFSIWINDSLLNLTGVEQLNTIEGLIIIGGNTSLASLLGLENLNSLGSGIYLAENNVLNDISVFSNIESTGGIWLQANPSLTDLNGLQNIESTIGSILLAQCSGIENMEGLNGLQNIGGYLSVQENGNLENLLGLNNLENIGDGLFIQTNESLVSLSGLDSLTVIGGALAIGGNFEAGNGNSSLINFTGLENLSSIGGDFFIRSDSALASLTGLENLTSIGGSFGIIRNPVLTDITALSKLSSIGGFLELYENISLPSLAGLDSIESGSIDSLYIMYNQNLSLCEVESVCNYLVNPNGETSIEYNAPGCNSEAEVEEACMVLQDEFINTKASKVFPNPFSENATIEYELERASDISISIFNSFGEQIELFKMKQLQGKQRFVWNANELPSGMYYYLIQTAEGTSSGKIVLQR
jgi:hypothetical protein